MLNIFISKFAFTDLILSFNWKNTLNLWTQSILKVKDQTPLKITFPIYK